MMDPQCLTGAHSCHHCELLRRLWRNLDAEEAYTVPPADIEGQLPADLRGTFFRNGPGLIQLQGGML